MEDTLHELASSNQGDQKLSQNAETISSTSKLSKKSKQSIKTKGKPPIDSKNFQGGKRETKANVYKVEKYETYSTYEDKTTMDNAKSPTSKYNQTDPRPKKDQV